MAIGRSENRDNPGNPAVLRHHFHVRDPIRVTHLGQRSCDRTTKAGHMTAIDRTVIRAAPPLRGGGRPHMGSGLRLRRGEGPGLAVRPEGANHQWRRNPPRELSIDLVADERLGRVTGRAGAS